MLERQKRELRLKELLEEVAPSIPDEAITPITNAEMMRYLLTVDRRYLLRAVHELYMYPSIVDCANGCDWLDNFSTIVVQFHEEKEPEDK